MQIKSTILSIVPHAYYAGKLIFTSKAWHQEVSLRAKVGVEAKEGAIASGRLG
jgi:hypothetical protein